MWCIYKLSPRIGSILSTKREKGKKSICQPKESMEKEPQLVSHRAQDYESPTENGQQVSETQLRENQNGGEKRANIA